VARISAAITSCGIWTAEPCPCPSTQANLLVSPIKENLVYLAPPGAPTWRMPEKPS